MRDANAASTSVDHYKSQAASLKKRNDMRLGGHIWSYVLVAQPNSVVIS